MSWDRAIADAEQLAAEAELRAQQLKKAANAFREMQASGEPFLVGRRTSESEAGLLGQE